MLPMSLNSGKGQSFEDKLYAFKYFLAGQGLSFVVLKATTSEFLGPKKKHLNYLVTITHEPNVSIPNIVKYLMQRARHPEWSVTFKSLITIHYLMSYGNEKFIQNLASSTVNKRTFDHLASFVDRTTSQAYDMSTFLRRYSRYINVKIQTYRLLGLDFCKIKRSPSTVTFSAQTSPTDNNDKSPYKMKTIPLDQLLMTLPVLQDQFDALLSFDASAKDLNNGIITAAFSMLYKDFVKLYIIYQTAIIRLLDLYFKLTQVKRVRELLDSYKKFLVRMDKVSDFMRVIDSVGMDKSDMPNLSRLPDLPLKTLEDYLQKLAIENKNRNSINQSAVVVELPKLQTDYFTLTRRNSRQLKGISISSTHSSLSPISSMTLKVNSQQPRASSSALTRADKLAKDDARHQDDDGEIKYTPFNNKHYTSSSVNGTSTESSASSSSSRMPDKRKSDSYYYYCELDPIQRGTLSSDESRKEQHDLEYQRPETSTSEFPFPDSQRLGSIYQNSSSNNSSQSCKVRKKDDSEIDLMIIDELEDENNNNNNEKSNQSSKGGQTFGQETVGMRSTPTPDGWVQVEL